MLIIHPRSAATRLQPAIAELVRLSLLERYIPTDSCHYKLCAPVESAKLRHMLLDKDSKNVDEYLPRYLAYALGNARATGVPGKNPVSEDCPGQEPDWNGSGSDYCLCPYSAAESLKAAVDLVLVDRCLNQKSITFRSDHSVKLLSHDKPPFVRTGDRPSAPKPKGVKWNLEVEEILKYVMSIVEMTKLVKSESGHYVTDNTEAEREEIIEMLLHAIALLRHGYNTILNYYSYLDVPRVEAVMRLNDLNPDEDRYGQIRPIKFTVDEFDDITLAAREIREVCGLRVARDVLVLYNLCLVVLTIFQGDEVKEMPNLFASVEDKTAPKMVPVRPSWSHVANWTSSAIFHDL